MQGFTKYCAKLLIVYIAVFNTVPAPVYASTLTQEEQMQSSILNEQQKGPTQEVVQQPTLPTSNVVALPQSSHSFVGASSVLGLSTHDNSTGLSARTRRGVGVQKLIRKDFRADEDIQLTLDNPDQESFKTKVVDAEGKEAPVQLQKSVQDGVMHLDVIPTNQFKPGKYVIEVTDQTGKKTQQDFTWGVLALNPDKAIYAPGETSDLSMAVLNDKGAMVCNATVELEIREQGTSLPAGTAGNRETLSTGNGKITVNPECNSHNFTLKPDYEAHYIFGAEGNYTLTLFAQTPNGSHTITDTIVVKKTTPFVIQRKSATRIYPPNSYPMQINVTANQNFNGTITETVPDNFAITPAENSTSYDAMKTVYLNGEDPSKSISQQVLGASTGGLVMPFDGNYPITQGFGAQLTDPGLQAFYTHYGLGGHDGIDFGLPMGTPLYAVDDGKVTLAGPGDYGTEVAIKHNWGQTYYGHMTKTSVIVGDDVHKGSLIGYSGMTGEATGPHLHFGMKPDNPDMSNGYYGKIDPMPYLPIGKGNPITQLQNLTSVLGASTSAAASVSAGATALAPLPSLIPATTAASSSANFTIEDGVSQKAAEDQPQAMTKMKVLKWHVSMKKGDKISLSYNYKTPQVSPQFYLLGSVKFYADKSKALAFDEGRQWQIAADDVGATWYHPTTNPNSGYEWRFRKKVTVDHNLVGTRTLPAADATNNTTANDNNTVSSLSWSHTTGTNSDRFLVVGVAPRSNQTVNSVTYAGASLTKITSTLYNTSARNFEMWYMVAPATGSNTVSVTLNGTSTGGLGAFSMSYYNVDQARPFSNLQDNVGSPVVANATTSSPGMGTNAYFNPYQLVLGAIASTQGSSILITTAGTGRVNNINANSLTMALSDIPGTGGATNVTWASGVSVPVGGIVFGINGASSTSNISNYPFAVDFTDTDLHSDAQSDGDDIVFADSNGTTVPHEIESYNSTTGRLIAWLKASSLTVDTDNVYYMYYGNPTAASQQDSNNTWNSNFKGVYHLRTNADSTSLSNDGTSVNTSSTTGVVDLAGNFAAATTSYIYSFPLATTYLNNTGSMSVSLWFKPTTTFDSSKGTDEYLFDLGSASPDSTNDFSVRLDAANGDMKFETQGSGNISVNSTGVASWTGGTWYYVTATYNSTNGGMNLYVNGLQFGSTTGASRGTVNAAVAIIGASNERGGKYYNGTIDEVRVTNNVLPIDWAKTDFTNQLYLTLFSEEGATEETKIYAPTNDMLMRHGKFFDTGSNHYGKQPFMF